MHVKQTKENEYLVKLLNLDMQVPMDVQTDAGIQKLVVDKKGVAVTSKTPVMIDPKVFYLKKVIIE